MNQALLNYRQLLAIKNQRTNRYIQDASSRPFASAAHPFLSIQDTPLEMSGACLILLQPNNPDYVGPLILNSPVMIYTPTGYFMVCHSQNGGGEIKFEKLTPAEASVSKFTKFLIQDANALTSKRQATTYDDIVFKCNETNYMISELSMLVNWNGNSIAIDSCWKLQKAVCPPMPDWIYLRPNISLSYLNPQAEAYLPSQIQSPNYLIKKDDRKTLGSHPPQIQQLHLIEDLLFCMMGIEGTFIKRRISGRDSFEYAIEPTLDQPTCEISLQQMVSKILPMCSHHDEVEFYVASKSKFDNGRVSQALCSALSVLTKEYITMINQLDNEFNSGELTLQKLWYYLQPSIKVMQALHSLTSETMNLNGGALLSKIYDLMNSNTDRQVISVYSYLVEKAFVPYAQQLEKWLFMGEVEDTFAEFLIQEKTSMQKNSLSQEFRDSYWEQRFTIRSNQVPKFLEKHQHIILRTGKYLNVAREISGFQPLQRNFTNLQVLIQSQDFSTQIFNAFEFANRQIIDILFRREDLLGRLRTIKRFFMMECGDFFIHFLELADEELSKPSKQISKEKLESLLDVSVRSVSTNDPYKEEIFGYLDSYTILEQIYALQNLKGNEFLTLEKTQVHSSAASVKGVDLFTIDLKVLWPLNLVLSRTSMVKYQIIFKSMFFFKYVERQLNNTWLLHQTVKELGLQKLFVRSHALLQKMLHFIKSYLYFFTQEVVERNFQQMEAHITKLDSFEEVVALHNKFIDLCLTESLLLSQNFMKGFLRLNQCCLTFAKAMQRFTSTLTRNDQNFNYIIDEVQRNELDKRKYWLEQNKQQVKQIITEKSYINTVAEFTRTFDDTSRDLIKSLYGLIANQHNYLIGLVTRLDFEGLQAGFGDNSLIRLN